MSAAGPRVAVVGDGAAAAADRELLAGLPETESDEVVAVGRGSGGAAALDDVTGRLDAIVVAGDVAGRPAATAWALERGIAVFVEAPLVPVGDAAAFGALAERVSDPRAAAVTTQAGFTLRFAPSLIRLHALLAESAIGPLVALRIARGHHLPQAVPGFAAGSDAAAGPLARLLGALDLARWLGGEYEAVHAFAGHLTGLATTADDVVQIGLRGARTLAAVHLDDVSRADTFTLECVCEGGLLRWSAADNVVRQYDGAHGNWTDEAQDDDTAITVRGRLRHFLAAARAGRPTKVPLADGLRTQALASGALAAAREDRVVALAPRVE